MSSIPSLASSAITILERANAAFASKEASPPAGGDLLKIANGLVSGSSGLTALAQAKVNEALFDRGTPDVHEMRVRLMERVGDALGLKPEDFDTVSAFGSAVKDKIAEIKRQPNGVLALMKIEKDVGLDKLGVSLDEFADALIDPAGSAAEKLDAALEKKIDEDLGAGKLTERALQAFMQTNEAGLYGV
jgi:hypothetical protein